MSALTRNFFRWNTQQAALLADSLSFLDFPCRATPAEDRCRTLGPRRSWSVHRGPPALPLVNADPFSSPGVFAREPFPLSRDFPVPSAHNPTADGRDNAFCLNQVLHTRTVALRLSTFRHYDHPRVCYETGLPDLSAFFLVVPATHILSLPSMKLGLSNGARLLRDIPRANYESELQSVAFIVGHHEASCGQ